MIKYINKDITTVTRGVVAHGVNCQGVMGSGVALSIRQKWPVAYRDYKAYCDIFKAPKHHLLGMVQTVSVEPDVVVANCFSQHKCGNDGQVYADIRAIKEALANVVDYARYMGLPLYFSKIGCGYGGLDWETDVEPILSKLCEEYDDVNIFVCDIVDLTL